VLSGRGLCDGPNPRPEESYRLWRVLEYDQVKIKTGYTCCEQVGREGRTTNKHRQILCTTVKCSFNYAVSVLGSRVAGRVADPLSSHNYFYCYCYRHRHVCRTAYCLLLNPVKHCRNSFCRLLPHAVGLCVLFVL
jgi:hypothetical protein